MIMIGGLDKRSSGEASIMCMGKFSYRPVTDRGGAGELHATSTGES